MYLSGTTSRSSSTCGSPSSATSSTPGRPLGHPRPDHLGVAGDTRHRPADALLPGHLDHGRPCLPRPGRRPQGLRRGHHAASAERAHERRPALRPGSPSASYGLTPDKLALAKPDAIVMHPGPMNRGVEIHSVVAVAPGSHPAPGHFRHHAVRPARHRHRRWKLTFEARK